MAIDPSKIQWSTPAAPGGPPESQIKWDAPAPEIAPAPASAAANLMSPVTELIPHYKQIEAQRRAEVVDSINNIVGADSTWDRLKASGMTVLNTLNYAMTPMSALERSFVSAPVERLTGIPHEMTEGIIDVAVPFAGEAKLGKAAASTVRAWVLGVKESPQFQVVQAAVAPATLTPAAKEVGARTSAMFGELAMRHEQAIHQLEGAKDALGKLPFTAQVKFIYNHERGISHGSTELDAYSAAIKDIFKDRVYQVHAFGEGYLEDLIDNYFPHMWKDPVKARDVMASIYGSKTMLGPKGFLKQRTHEYISDGMAAGLELADSNPINAVLAKVREMDRFILGKRVVDTLKEDGFLKFFGGHLPPGWAEIKDPVARVSQKLLAGLVEGKPTPGGIATSDVVAGGFMPRGQYAATTEVARVLNNDLSRSGLSWEIFGKRVKPFDQVRAAGNALNMVQLGLSGFHLSFVSVDSMTSKTALAIEQAMSGRPLTGAKTLLGAPFAPATSWWKGRKLIEASLNPAAHPQLQEFVRAIMEGGGRLKMPQEYAAAERGGLMRAPYAKAFRADGWKGVGKAFGDSVANNYHEIGQSFHDKGVWGGIWETAGRIAQTTSSWLMDGVVPQMKLGVFHDLVKDAMVKNPNITAVEFRDAAQAAWASVDNRLGQLVYDNMHWNKTGKELAHLSVRSVGWNLGTIRELGGGATDWVKAVDAYARGDKAAFTHRMAYTIALPFTAGSLGSLYMYMKTGQSPSELKDYFFPKTGGTTKLGTEERVSIPSYMKDVYEYGADAGHTLLNKTHPIIPMIYQMATNTDYFGYPVGPTNQGAAEFLNGYITYLSRNVLPFSVQGAIKQAQQDDRAGLYASFFGIVPAPGYITSPDEIASRKARHQLDLIKRKAKQEGPDLEIFGEEE